MIKSLFISSVSGVVIGVVSGIYGYSLLSIFLAVVAGGLATIPLTFSSTSNQGKGSKAA